MVVRSPVELTSTTHHGPSPGKARATMGEREKGKEDDCHSYLGTQITSPMASQGDGRSNLCCRRAIAFYTPPQKPLQSNGARRRAQPIQHPQIWLQSLDKRHGCGSRQAEHRTLAHVLHPRQFRNRRLITFRARPKHKGKDHVESNLGRRHRW